MYSRYFWGKNEKKYGESLTEHEQKCEGFIWRKWVNDEFHWLQMVWNLLWCVLNELTIFQAF